jgi:hypothetical protein
LINKHIPKIIHITWKTKDILEVNHWFPQNCIQRLVQLADGWQPTISDDNDVEQYLRDNLSVLDYKLLEDRHIVEKTDVWRLIKMYNEGGLYTDIDRLCNISINDIIEDSTRLVLPECYESDFSQDFMCSAPNNPMFLEALNINLVRRRMGCRDVYLLGPQTYFHGITKTMTGEMIQIQPPKETFEKLRDMIYNSGFIITYKETPPYNTIMYRPENGQINFNHEEMKRDFYNKCGLKHWTGDW